MTPEAGDETRGGGSAGLPCDDPPRLGQLLAGLEPRLSAVALRVTRDPDAASDVVQDAFEKVLRRCEQFRGGAKPSTWMHRIVVNEAIQWLRREARRAPGRIDPEEWALATARPEDPERAAAAREELARVARAIARLPVRERHLLTERSLRGRGYAALARELDLSTGAAKLRAFRARRGLAAGREAAERDPPAPPAGLRGGRERSYGEAPSRSRAFSDQS